MFRFNYFGLQVNVISNNSLFIDLIKSKFEAFNLFSTYQFEKRNINISFINNQKLQHDEPEKIINSGTFINKNILYNTHSYLLTTTIIRTEFKKNDIFKINYSFKSSIYFDFLDFFLMGLLKKQLFQNLIKLYTEQSLLWNLTTKHRLYCLHASSIEKNNKVTIFTGLNGVGKSTLALYLTQHQKFKFFSDNYLLISNKTAYFFPDNVRLSKDSLNLLHLKAKNFFGFNKFSLSPETTQFSTKIKAKINSINITFRGNIWSRKKLKETVAQNIIKSLQISSAEAVEYSPVSQYHPLQSELKLFVPNILYYELIIGQLKDLKYEF